MQQPMLETLRWIRTIGDVVFIIGALAVVWQVVSALVISRRPAPDLDQIQHPQQEAETQRSAIKA